MTEEDILKAIKLTKEQKEALNKIKNAFIDAQELGLEFIFDHDTNCVYGVNANNGKNKITIDYLDYISDGDPYITWNGIDLDVLDEIAVEVSPEMYCTDYNWDKIGFVEQR